ncbi:hypothetical protein SeMB42_g04483 [Synchytrium endobioticum]|uniref:50S ribosomal protein L35 n=1 Tax=Synchytrium endobioticum TaxID=286115 RepID=A0A507CXV3_9FUNG|nr:hypothetical protein SeMB42_g04483 [Synchytrium endobioticum]
MQIRHAKTWIAAHDGPARITAMAWSPNNERLAICGADRIIQLFDDKGDRKDRFATKPADPKTAKSYQIVAIVFSPDSGRLAVAQSDCVVFVYKLGLEWGEKKSICNKLIQSCEITALTWPLGQPNTLVFGTCDGKVRVGNLKVNKAATLYQTETCVVSAASSPDGTAIITGHIDGSVNRFFFDDGVSGASQGRFTMHSCAPTVLAWGETVVAAGSDGVVRFYDDKGHEVQSFEYNQEDDEVDFTSIAMNVEGQTAALGAYNRIYTFNWLKGLQAWEEAKPKQLENFYTVTCLIWKPDGSRLYAGSQCGAVDEFDCCLKKTTYKGKFEFTYVSSSQVIVKRLSTGARIVLKSHYGYEIEKINIFQDQFLVAHTPETLMLGDLASCKLSEISWTSGGNEKFYFENPQFCMVFNAGELSLVEYGVNEVFGSCRTEHMSPHLISVRIKEDAFREIAYLVDLQTAFVMDLNTGLNIAAIHHDAKIDWLELSNGGTKLLYRDKSKQLYVYDLSSQTRTTLLSFCSYVSWVPNSDVVVAQTRGNLCIWYAIDHPERITTFPVKGDVDRLERIDGKTQVIVDEGINTVAYTLDDALIEFGSALGSHDYEKSVALLETLGMSPETEALWNSLGQNALRDRNLTVAERCFSAMGDVARARYIHILDELAEKYRAQGWANPTDQYVIRARLALLDKQFKVAERIMLEQGQVEETMEMYQELHKWDMAIKVAEIKNHPQLEKLRENYFRWLIDSGQQDKAGELKETQGDAVAAINLYLEGGMPARAAHVLNHFGLGSDCTLTEKIASALFKAGLYERAGELFQRIPGASQRALDAFRKGRAFRAAVELARAAFPREVVILEEQWGDHLVASKQMDAAINHYIEAVDSLPEGREAPYLVELARHFAEVHDLAQAEKYFVAAGKPQDAIDMYKSHDRWDKAHTLATSFLGKDEAKVLSLYQAKELESKQRYRDAEKIYITLNEPDLAIEMYKTHKQFDSLIRLVAAHRKDKLSETHVFLAKQMESEGNLRGAEHHYVEGGDWKAAVNMYVANNMFEEGHRIAKIHGGPNSANQIAYLWARSLGGETAAKLLSKFALLDAAIDYAMENHAFEFAFELARFGPDKSKLSDVHLRQAMILEDNGQFIDAEVEFIAAGKPHEAVSMHIHNQDWERAMLVVEKHDPDSATEVLVAQAAALFNKKEYGKTETLLLRAQRPDLAIKMYKEAGQWKDAIQFAKEHAPSKLAEVHADYDRFLASKPDAGREEILASARLMEQHHDYARAIEMYLRVNPQMTNDPDALESAWCRAVEIANKHVAAKSKDVAGTVGNKLEKLGRLVKAGDVYLSADLIREAADAYTSAGAWDKARQAASRDRRVADIVESAYVKHLRTQGRADALVSVDVTAALDVYAERGEWDKCLETAAGQGPEVLSKYLGLRCGTLIKDGKVDAAVDLMVQYDCPPTQELYDTYRHLSKNVLQSGSPVSLASVREMLFKLVYGVGFQPLQGLPLEFSKMLIIAHVISLKNYCQTRRELVQISGKQSISLLRYVNYLVVDRAFYDAGASSKAAGMTNMAFVCWNRFLDILEAVESGDSSVIENADFADTDIPFDFKIPQGSSLMNKRADVKDWILQVSLDQRVRQEVDKRTCEGCGTTIYAAALSCPNCRMVHEPCIITGYPVLRTKASCGTCKALANREDWNRFVAAEHSTYAASAGSLRFQRTHYTALPMTPVTPLPKPGSFASYGDRPPFEADTEATRIPAAGYIKFSLSLNTTPYMLLQRRLSRIQSISHGNALMSSELCRWAPHRPLPHTRIRHSSHVILPPNAFVPSILSHISSFGPLSGSTSLSSAIFFNHNQIRTKKTEGRTTLLNSARVKIPSKRKGKKYKMKNHQAAVKRWIVMADGMFKRAQAGKRHLNSKMRAWKRRAKRRRVLANSTQRKMLRRMVPYWRKRYMRE